MGQELRRMVRAGAPASWTPLMRFVAMEIADDAGDPSRGLPADGGWPWSAIPIEGYWDARRGKWREGLTERCGMSARAISRTLTELARAGYEMREAAGTGKDGRVVFTAPGRAMRFRVPILPPRPDPQRPPNVAGERSPHLAGVDSERSPLLVERSPLLVETVAESGDPISSGSPQITSSSNGSAVDLAGVEGARATSGQPRGMSSIERAALQAAEASRIREVAQARAAP